MTSITQNIKKNKPLLIGVIVKTHALRGQVLIEPSFDFYSIIPNKTKVTLKSENQTEENKILNVCGKNGKRIIVSLQGIETVEDAMPLVGAELWINMNVFSYEHVWLSPVFVLGCYVFDINSNHKIGIIDNFYDLPNNPIIALNVDNKEILLPFNKHIIKKISLEEELVVADIPNGLVEVYLNSTKKQKDEN